MWVYLIGVGQHSSSNGSCALHMTHACMFLYVLDTCPYLQHLLQTCLEEIRVSGGCGRGFAWLRVEKNVKCMDCFRGERHK